MILDMCTQLLLPSQRGLVHFPHGSNRAVETLAAHVVEINRAKPKAKLCITVSVCQVTKTNLVAIKL
jgi:hypothetical protein